MQICSACHTENRDGTLYCLQCGELLPDKDEPAGAAILTADPDTESQPVSTLTPRPEGAIFGDRFLYQALVFSIPDQMVYLVREGGQNDTRRIWQCSNEACGAVFCDHQPAAGNQKCVLCGSDFIEEPLNLLLSETLAAPSPALVSIAGLNLAHASVRAPVAVFSEQVGKTTRWSQINPETEPLLTTPDPGTALLWIAGAARALDFLASQGICFGGRINESCFGIINDRLVWADFSLAELQDSQTALPQDVRALAQVLAHWLTGKRYPAGAAMTAPELTFFIEKALSSTGYATGSELAAAIDAVRADLAAPRSFDVRVGRRTDVGQVRALNEDSLFCFELNRTLTSVSQPVCLAVVADGMGGHSAGEVASGIIVTEMAAISGELTSAEVAKPGWDGRAWLEKAVSQANLAVFDQRKSQGTDMGSTMVAVLVVGRNAYVTHVGDSRVYLMTPKGWQQLTEDHSLVARLVASGQVKPDAVRTHPQRNIVYRTIGDRKDLELEIAEVRLEPGDRLLLCSDGLWEMLEDQAVYELVMAAAHPQEACDRLVQAANAAGGEDNISVVIVEHKAA